MTTILVINDSKFQRKKLVDILSSAGFKTAGAGTAEASLEHIRREAPEGILLSLIMMETEGVPLLHMLRRDHPQIPVIVLSPNLEDATHQQCVDLGVHEVFKRLPNTEEIRESFQSILDLDRSVAPTATLPASVGKKTILIVDDSKFQRKKIRQVLQGLGFATLEAGNGKEGLLAIEQYSPDLVVIDLLMPIMGGLEFLHEMKTQRILIPVIVHTNDSQDNVRRDCLDLGAMAFLNKPSNPQRFLSVIDSIFHK